MRATLHKLLAGASLVVLTVFGLTVLSSSSTDSSDNTQVWAFLDTTCSSSFAELFDSIEDMLEQNGKERWGIVWDYKSYYRVAELNTPDPQCHLVSSVTAEPPVTTRVVPLPPIEIPVGGSGGGGSGGGPDPGEGQEKEEDTVDFDDNDAVELKNCLMNKLEALSKSKKKEEKLKKPSEMVKNKDSLGCFIKLGLDDLKFEKTSYSWRTSSENIGYLGLTSHAKKNVTLYTTRISKRVNSRQLRRKNMQFNHMVTNVGLDELVHTMQDAPKPYEMYDLQVQANVFAYAWYKQLHNGKVPPIAMYNRDIIDKHRDKDCNLKGEFLTKKTRYQELEVKKANGTLVVDPEKKIDEPEEMKDIVDWFWLQMPEFQISGPYDSGANLGCTDADKKEKK